MNFADVEAAAASLRMWLDDPGPRWEPDQDLAIVLDWVDNYRSVFTELDAMLAAEKQRAAALKVYAPDNGQEARK